MPRKEPRTFRRTLTLDPYCTSAAVRSGVLLVTERKWVEKKGWVEKEMRIEMSPDVVTTIADALWDYQKAMQKDVDAMAADLKGE